MYWGVPQNVWLSFTSSTFLVLVTFMFWPLLRLIWYIWILAFYPHLVALFRLVDLNTNTFLLV